MEQWGGGSMRIPRGHLNLVLSQFNVRIYVSTSWRMELLGEFNQIPGLSDSNHIMTSWRICQQLLLSVDFNSTESLRIQSPSEKGKGTYIYFAKVFGRPNHLTIWLDASKKMTIWISFQSWFCMKSLNASPVMHIPNIYTFLPTSRGCNFETPKGPEPQGSKGWPPIAVFYLRWR